MSKQLSTSLLLVRPHHFSYNFENADNTFSQPDEVLDPEEALQEFDAVVTVLQELGLRLVILEDESLSPDAVFPNNWFTLLPDGSLILYPLKSPARRREVRQDLPGRLRRAGCRVVAVIDWSDLASDGIYLEGTGSLVLDHVHGKAYTALSERTDVGLVRRWADLTGYKPICFEPVSLAGADGKKHPIYHTNVMMTIGQGFALVCPDAIADTKQREGVLAQLSSDGLEIIELSLDQIMAFAGNMLQVRTPTGPCLLMSEGARAVLRPKQLASLARHTALRAIAIPTIERVGGGSIRCMLGEIGYK